RPLRSFPTRRSSDLTSAIVFGYQSILLFVFAELMAVETGLHPLGSRFTFLLQRRTLERCIVIGVTLINVGVVLGIIAARVQTRLDRKSTRLNSSHDQ